MTYKSKDWVFTLLAAIIVFVGCIVNLSGGDTDEESYSYNDESSAEVQESISWDLTDGVLTISGKGAMPDFEDTSEDLWQNRYKEVTHIVIEDGVTSIGDFAFYSYKNLESVNIPDSVTTIGNYAFCYCENLTNVTIPDSVTTIGDFGFYGCESLTSINIPGALINIGERALNNCDSLTSITVGEGNQYFTDENGILFNKDKTAIIKYPPQKSGVSYTIPDSVIIIGDYTFYCCNSLISIGIPDRVTTIGNYAFAGCENLTSITVPDGVTTIGDHAFYYCEHLTSITVGEGNQYYTDEDGILFNKDKTAIIQYPPLKSGDRYTIPDSVTAIGDGAFSTCDSLTSITIPDGVTSIGDWAFYSCDGFTSITIPNSVDAIGDYMFYYCKSLTKVTIPDSVTAIGYRAFHYCDSLNTVYYGGSEGQWNNIDIEDDNSPLTGANIIYNYN